MHISLRQIKKLRAGRGVEHDDVPLAVPGVIEEVQHDFRAGIPGDIRHRMRPDLRPFLALFDVLLDVPPPAHREPLRFRLLRLVVQDVDVALKVTHGDEFHLTISIHVRQPEPAVRAALVIAQFSFFAPGGALENHDTIVRGDTDLL